MPHVLPCSDMGTKKKKERDEVFLAFGIASSNKRPARRAINSVVKRAFDNYIVVPEL
jgi:hypothetical protein